MKDTVKMVAVLTLICAVAAGLLAFTNAVTKGPIEQVKRAELLNAIKKVLPDYDNEPDRNIFSVSADGRDWEIYVARKDSAYSGAAISSFSDEGYSGRIRVLVGVRPDGTVSGVEMLEQSETPGLGAKIALPEFRDQFKGRPLEPLSDWAVVQDGGKINAITGATISPRAVCDAVKRALSVYENKKDAIAAVKQ